MEAGRSGMGIRKHRKSGKVTNADHFTGHKGSGTKRKRKSSRKERNMRSHSHHNKYKETAQ